MANIFLFIEMVIFSSRIELMNSERVRAGIAIEIFASIFAPIKYLIPISKLVA